MNGFRRCASPGIQSARFKHVFENGAMPNRRRTNNKENTMLRTFAAVLVATALVAAPALAQNSGTPPANKAPLAQTTPNAPAASTTPAKPAVKSTKSAKHSVKHARKHHARHIRKHHARKKSSARMHQTRHMKSGKAHAASAAKSGKQS
jgi:negative regulator of sigma E activity